MWTVLARRRAMPRSTLHSLGWPISLTVRVAPGGAARQAAGRATPIQAMPVPPRLGPDTTRVFVAGPLRIQRTVERLETAAVRRAMVPDALQRRFVSAELFTRYRRTSSRERELVERLVARRERRERQEAPLPVPTDALSSGVRPTVGPLAAPAAVVAHARPSPRLEPLPAPPPRGGASVTDMGARPRPEAPAVDVQALADQVIRTIDQRVIAARERLGTP
jgi:hypothetical protein